MTNTFDKELLRSRVADKLVAMEKMFDSRCKLTFVMRAPHLPDGDMIVTGDNVDAVITALQRLCGYEEIKAPELAAAASDDGAARQPRAQVKAPDGSPAVICTRCNHEVSFVTKRCQCDDGAAVELLRQEYNCASVEALALSLHDDLTIARRASVLPAVIPCYVCEMGVPTMPRHSRNGRPVQVLCNACLDNEVIHDPRHVRTADDGAARQREDAKARGYQRAYERLELCPDHRDKANGRCIVCQAEERTRAELRADDGAARAYDYIRAVEGYRLNSELWPQSPIELTVAMIDLREKLRAELRAALSSPSVADSPTLEQLQAEIAQLNRLLSIAAEKAQQAKELTTGVAMIAAERTRQQQVEGWTPAHDDGHDHGELLAAAYCYFWLARDLKHVVSQPYLWPWEQSWWKPSDDPIRNLTKAGALIAAEIDRLTRLSAPSASVADSPTVKAND